MASINERNSKEKFFNDHQKRLNRERVSKYYKKRRMNNNTNNICHDLGHMNQICSYCDAKFWMDEKNKKSIQISPTFTVCCADGKVKLAPLLKPSPYLMNMYTSLEPEANSFRRNARSYNSLLACISFGANVNEEF